MLDIVTRSTVEQRVLAVVREVLALDESELNIDSSIAEDLATDSLDQLTLFMALEDEFGDRISEQNAAGFTTLRDVADYIAERINLATA